MPGLGDDLTAWTTWNGTSEITATNGYHIAVAEVDKYYRCDKVGKTTVTSKLEEAGE